MQFKLRHFRSYTPRCEQCVCFLTLILFQAKRCFLRYLDCQEFEALLLRGFGNFFCFSCLLMIFAEWYLDF